MLSIEAFAITEFGIVSSESSPVRRRVERKPTCSTTPSVPPTRIRSPILNARSPISSSVPKKLFSASCAARDAAKPATPRPVRNRPSRSRLADLINHIHEHAQRHSRLCGPHRHRRDHVAETAVRLEQFRAGVDGQESGPRAGSAEPTKQAGEQELLEPPARRRADRSAGRGASGR